MSHPLSIGVVTMPRSRRAVARRLWAPHHWRNDGGRLAGSANSEPRRTQLNERPRAAEGRSPAARVDDGPGRARSLATSSLTRADSRPGSIRLSPHAPSDNTCVASDHLGERQAGQFALVVGSCPSSRPRSATLIEDRMFSSAFSTRRNAAIAWTSGSLGVSADAHRRRPVLKRAGLEGRRAIERHGRLQIGPPCGCGRTGRCPPTPRLGGLLTFSSSKCPNGGGRSSVLPNEPKMVRKAARSPRHAAGRAPAPAASRSGSSAPRC